MNYVAIVNEAIGDIYTVKNICYYSNDNKFWVGVYAGDDPTMLGQVTFKGNSTDVQISLRYRHGKYYEVPNFNKIDLSLMFCLCDPDFFKKLRQLFIDNMCWRLYREYEILLGWDDWRRNEQEKVHAALNKGRNNVKETTTP